MPPRALPFAPLPPVLADFIFGENDEALLAVRALAEGKGAEPCVYVWGAAGVGKSCLLRAACQTARARGLGAYRVADGFAAALPPPVEGLLAADDVQLLSGAAQKFLFDWHNRMAAGGGRRFLLCAGNAAPARLPIDAELKTRLAAGLVFRLRALDDSHKKRALQKCAARRGFRLPPEVADLLLLRLPRNMRSLESALADLDSFLLKEKKPLNSRWARAWLAAHIQRQEANAAAGGRAEAGQ